MFVKDDYHVPNDIVSTFWSYPGGPDASVLLSPVGFQKIYETGQVQQRLCIHLGPIMIPIRNMPLLMAHNTRIQLKMLKNYVW